jgi:hypothetical protein
LEDPTVTIATLGAYANATRRCRPQSPAPAPAAPGLQQAAALLGVRPAAPAVSPPAVQPRIPTATTFQPSPRPATAPTLDDLERRAGGTLPTTMEAWGTQPAPGPTTASLAGGASRRIDTVTDLQRALKSAGFDPGPIDGRMGPRTDYAIRRFQAANGLQVDGAAGPRTLRALGANADDDGPAAPTTPGPVRVGALQRRLQANLHNPYKGRVHQCFRYAWTTATKAGGRNIGNAPASHAGRNASIQHLDAMIDRGQVTPGDVIYVNRRPGADPSSTNLAYGPHWFVYMGNGRFADQYGVRDADAMAQFVPGRKIDTIYHPFTQQA